MTITLDRLKHEQIELLRQIRNSSSSSFFNTRYIRREDQENWWYCYQSDNALMIYTIWMNSVTPVGFLSVRYMAPVRYYRNGLCQWFDRYEIGNLLVDPNYRGRGIMTRALVEIRRLHNPLTIWIAHVKKNNAASLKLFQNAGFFTAEKPKGKRKCRSLSSSIQTPQATTLA